MQLMYKMMQGMQQQSISQALTFYSLWHPKIKGCLWLPNHTHTHTLIFTLYFRGGQLGTFSNWALLSGYSMQVASILSKKIHLQRKACSVSWACMLHLANCRWCFLDGRLLCKNILPGDSVGTPFQGFSFSFSRWQVCGVVGMLSRKTCLNVV